MSLSTGEGIGYSCVAAVEAVDLGALSRHGGIGQEAVKISFGFERPLCLSFISGSLDGYRYE